MNVIFISPQFPRVCWNFCDRLKKKGVKVLGIGDTPYEQLSSEVKNSLTEYYYLNSLGDYEQTMRAVAFFTFKYGKIDWLESNNEYWLEQDARLRTDFNITTGWHTNNINDIKNKSAMKAYYKKAGIPTARLHNVTTAEAAKSFIAEVGYPVIVKPDIGVGANDTYKLENDDDLRHFIASRPTVPYVMEEFVTGDICSYDAIVDADSNPLFESMTLWPPSVMDIVLYQLDLAYYTSATVDEKLLKAGRALTKAYKVRSRFIHFEFFRLTKSKKGLGEVGDIVGLEVNMRPAGGYTTDMMNFAHSTDVYQLWADMIVSNKRLLPDNNEHYYCVYAGRRDFYRYQHTHDEILARYGDKIVMCERMPELFCPQMGNQMYTAKLPDEKATKEFIEFVQKRQ